MELFLKNIKGRLQIFYTISCVYSSNDLTLHLRHMQKVTLMMVANIRSKSYTQLSLWQKGMEHPVRTLKLTLLLE